MAKEARPLTWDEVRAMEKYCLENGMLRERAIIAFVASTGFRHCEWSPLKWKDILNKHEITVYLTKQDKYRTAAIPGFAQAALADYHVSIWKRMNPRLRDSLRDEFAFKGKHSDQPISRSGVIHIMRKIAEACGLDPRVSSHSFRKGFAIRSVELLGDDERAMIEVGSWLGHTSLSTTYRYLGFTAKRKAATMQKLWE